MSALKESYRDETFVARAPGPAQPLPPDQMEMSSLMTVFETLTAASLASVAKVRSFSSFESQSPVTGSPNRDKSFESQVDSESRDNLRFMLARKMAASKLGVDIIAKSSSSSAGGSSGGVGGNFALASVASVDSVSHAWLLGQQPESLAKSFDKNHLSPLKFDLRPSTEEIFSAEENGQTQIFLLFPLLGGCSGRHYYASKFLKVFLIFLFLFLLRYHQIP